MLHQMVALMHHDPFLYQNPFVVKIISKILKYPLLNYLLIAQCLMSHLKLHFVDQVLS